MSNERIHPQQKLTSEKILANAVDLAREALLEVTNERNVGDHVGLVQEAPRVVSHAFDCLMPGYRGWYWVVTLSRAHRARRATVDELSLRPGEDALLAPEWVPWADRLRPEDVAPSDRLPYNPDDSNLQANADPDLQPNFEAVGADEEAIAIFEWGQGRERVLSDTGRTAAYRRWYKSDVGPRNKGTRDAKAVCASCGYLMHMAGSARQLFGVCANEWSPFDGRVVSLDHGCGAHSETDVSKWEKLWEQSDPVLDETDVAFEEKD